MAAGTVGLQFVQTYYKAFCTMPDLLHQFYDKKAGFNWTVEGDEKDKALDSLPTIKEKIDAKKSLLGEAPQVQLVEMNFQSSVDGGVFVLVGGRILNPKSIRKFVQSFFLASHGTAYVISNDVLCILEETQAQAPHPQPQTQEVKSSKEAENPKQTKKAAPEDSKAAQSGSASTATEPKEKRNKKPARKNKKDEAKEDKVPAPAEPVEATKEPANPPQAEAAPAAAAPPPADDRPRSYAQAASYAAAAMAAAAAPAPTPAPAPAKAAATAPPPTGKAAAGAPGASLFVSHLPDSATEDAVRDVFSAYGTVTGITLRMNKNNSMQYAFVDFADRASAEKCLLSAETEPLTVDGQAINVDEKNTRRSGPPKNRRGRGRGEGRGRGPRTDANGFQTQGRRN